MRTQYLKPKDQGKPTVAVENQKVAVTNRPVLIGRPVLSLEEEIVALQEAGNIQAEVASGLEEATRVEDVSDNLLSMADQVQDIEALTPEQAALIDTAAEMGVAGTDTDPDAVIPSMESYIGGSLALAVEGWRETAANIWQNIRAFVEKLWQQIREFWHRVFSVFPRQLARVKALRDVIAAKKKDGNKEPKANQISMAVGVTALSYPGYLVKSSKDIQHGLADLKKLGDWTLGQYTQAVKRQGDIVAEELKAFKPSEASKTLQNAAKKLVGANFRDVPKAPSNGYMGCFELQVRRIADKKAAADEHMSDARLLNALRHTFVQIIRSDTRSLVTKNTMDTPKLADIESLLNEVEKLVKMAASFETSANYKSMQTTKQNMTTAGDNAQAVWNREGNLMGQAEGAYAMDVMKSLMNFNTVYTKWSSSLPGDYIKRLMDATRATLVFCDKAIAQY